MMFITFFALVLALVFALSDFTLGEPIAVVTLLTIISGSFLVLIAAAHIALPGPLQRAELKLTPRISELFYQDLRLRLLASCMLAFPLLTTVAALALTGREIAPFSKYLLSVWIVLFGLVIDFAGLFIRRGWSYLDPLQTIGMLEQKARHYALRLEETEMCSWIDALAEAALKAIDRSSPGVANKSLESLGKIISAYLEKRRSTRGDDNVRYALFFFFDRIETLFNRALEKELDSVYDSIISLLGKTSLASARYDIAFASYSLDFIGKFAKQAQNKGLEETTAKASWMLQEAAKDMVREVGSATCALRDPFFTLVTHLETLIKESFRKDKSIKHQLLIKPFAELKLLLKNEKLLGNSDVAIVNKDLDRILEEFALLGQIMSKMPHTETPAAPLRQDAEFATSHGEDELLPPQR